MAERGLVPGGGGGGRVPVAGAWTDLLSPPPPVAGALPGDRGDSRALATPSARSTAGQALGQTLVFLLYPKWHPSF